MSLTVLSVAYPLAPVGPDAVGGAEQVLAQLDAALVAAGHCSLVVACEGSATSGTLVATPRIRGVLDEAARRQAQAAHRKAIQFALNRWPVDLIHLHGIDFINYLPAPGVPALVTLHLPVAWYPPDIFELTRAATYLHGVSAHQMRACPPSQNILPPIENGVDERLHELRHARRGYVLGMGRICPEKGWHLALDAARLAGRPLLLAGEVFPYPDHLAYFEHEIVPRLDALRRYIGPVGMARKRRLLAAARCLVLPSHAPETSSLAAMEALACGTPVVACPSGALAEMIEPGCTGFLVSDVEEMARAIEAAGGLSAELCRAEARRRFPQARMCRQYLALYEHLTRTHREAPLHAA